MHKSAVRRFVFALFALPLVPAFGQAPDPRVASAAESRQADRLLTVDCLLPGQVRQLGTSMTYLTPRRPVRTSAADCEVRGGEYVAYDRANYSTALKVWQPTADQGDKEAQTNVGEIFWRDTLIDAAMFREWIVNVGQRPAPARLANVIVELRERLRAIGKVTGNSFDMPLTQEQIGEALGITGVHANRVIKQMRQDGILELSRGRVTVFDEFRLMELADFDNRYLHQSPAL